jgi:hypothetical protein
MQSDPTVGDTRGALRHGLILAVKYLSVIRRFRLIYMHRTLGSDCRQVLTPSRGSKSQGGMDHSVGYGPYAVVALGFTA